MHAYINTYIDAYVNKNRLVLLTLDQRVVLRVWHVPIDLRQHPEDRTVGFTRAVAHQELFLTCEKCRIPRRLHSSFAMVNG